MIDVRLALIGAVVPGLVLFVCGTIVGARAQTNDYDCRIAMANVRNEAIAINADFARICSRTAILCQTINVGAEEFDGTGDPLNIGLQKIDTNLKRIIVDLDQ